MKYGLGGLVGLLAGLCIAWVLWGARVPMQVCLEVAREVASRPPAAPLAAPTPPAAVTSPGDATPPIAVAALAPTTPSAAALPPAAAPLPARPQPVPPVAAASSGTDGDQTLDMAFLPGDPNAKAAFAEMGRQHAKRTHLPVNEADARAVSGLTGRRQKSRSGIYTFLNVMIVSSPFVLLVLLLLIGDDWLRLRQSYSARRRKKSLRRILAFGIPLGLIAMIGIVTFILHLLGLIR